MAMAEFGGADNDGYSIDTIVGWLETRIEDEEKACENLDHKKSSARHRIARLDRAYEAMQALYEVAEWTPKLTKAQFARQHVLAVASGLERTEA